MAGNLEFGVATPDDAPELRPIIKSAYRGEKRDKAWTTEGHLLTGERIDVPGIIAKITTPDAAVLVARDASGAIVGCCEVAKSSETIGYFGLFAVDPAKQGDGLGRKVLAYAEEYCRKTWGVQKLEMQVIFTRDELISWYIRRGYNMTGEKRPFPYAELINDTPLRHDLYFEILEKDLTGIAPAPVAA